MKHFFHYIKNMISLFVVLVVLQACSVTNNRDFLNQYEASYKKNNPYRSHEVKHDGNTINVREYGQPNLMPTIIMMHGFPDSLHLYDWLVPEINNNRHIITFDFIGWGDSDKPRQHLYNVASLRNDLDAVVGYFKHHKVVLVVHDASGQVGIDWALDHPEKTSGLILLNTYYGPSPSLRAPEAIELFSTPGIRQKLAIWATSHSDYLWIKRYNQQMAQFMSSEEKLLTFQRVLGFQSLQIKNAFYGLNNGLNDEIEKRRENEVELGQFKPPVRIVFGKDDPYLNEGVARELNQLFKNSELYLLENAGHFVQVDQPKKVADLIRTFPTQAQKSEVIK